MVLINDYKAQVKMRPLGSQVRCAVGLVRGNSDMTAEVLAVFCSVKPNTGSEGCDRTLIPRTGRSGASRQRAKQTDSRNLTSGEVKTELQLFFPTD